MLDYLQAVSWSLAYIFLIIYAIKFKHHGIPAVAICLNFSWETVALINSLLKGSLSGTLIVHVIWFELDLVIMLLFVLFEDGINKVKKRNLLFLAGYFCTTALFFFLLGKGLMLLSSFIIDLVMAISYIVFILLSQVKKHWLSYLIGIFKLMGDVFAWQFYKDSIGIDQIGIVVLICNLVYMAILIFKPCDQGLLQTLFRDRAQINEHDR